MFNNLTWALVSCAVGGPIIRVWCNSVNTIDQRSGIECGQWTSGLAAGQRSAVRPTATIPSQQSDVGAITGLAAGQRSAVCSIPEQSKDYVYPNYVSDDYECSIPSIGRSAYCDDHYNYAAFLVERGSLYTWEPAIPYLCAMSCRLVPRHCIGGVTSQMNLSSWEYYLLYESSDVKKDYLHRGILEGFRIVDSDSHILQYECENYRSVLDDQAFEYVDNLISSEYDQEKFVYSSSKPHFVHALGAIPKGDGSFRPITDCRRPEGLSINNYMESTFHTFNYVTVDQVASNVTPGCYMATVDIASAYRSVSIRQDNWKYQGISWKMDNRKAYLFDVRLSFGLRCAPYQFTEISDFVVRTMSRLGYEKVANYLDDFLVFGSTFQECQQAQSTLISLLGDLGFLVSWKKCASPSQCVRYLGILIDSTNMTLRLPQDKLDKLHSELEFFKDKSRATRRQIQRLCGIVAHCAKVVRGGRTFSRRLIDLLSGLKEGNPRIRLTDEFKMDIQWWLDFASRFNGLEKIIFPNDGQGPIFATDSCLRGYGIVDGTDWQAGYFNSNDITRTWISVLQDTDTGKMLKWSILKISIIWNWFLYGWL